MGMHSQKREENPDFLRLYNKYEPLIRAYVRNGLNHQDDVMEVMQETSMIAWKKFDQIKNSEEDFGKWMCVVARYEILKFRRTKARDRLVLSEDLTDKILAEGIDELPKRNRILDHLHSCLGKLSDFNQMLVKTPYQKNASIAELAKRLEKKPDALYKKASRLRLALAECVEQKLLSET